LGFDVSLTFRKWILLSLLLQQKQHVFS
jgi:hypothetical protein